MITKKIDVKLERVLKLNGKAAQVPQYCLIPTGFLEEWDRLKALYFKQKRDGKI